MAPLFGVLLAAYAVVDGGAALRSSCDPGDPVVARLAAGTAVDIRFSINGEWGACYKVAASVGGRLVEGYLPAQVLQGLEAYQKARSSGGSIGGTAESPKPAPLTVAQRAAAARSLGADNARLEQASELMKANDNQEALGLIEQVLRNHPKEPGVLAMAGMAAYQGDDPKRAIGYWRQSLDLEASPPIESLVKRAEKEVAADSASERLFGARFTLRYNANETPPEQARAMIPVLDSEWARLSQQLGCETGERISAAILSPNAYRQATGAAEWSGGQFDGRIRVAQLEPGGIGAETRRVFAHEIVHACIARIAEMPSWLHEGLAQQLSGEGLSATDRALVMRMAKAGQLPSLRNLSQTWSRMSSEHAHAAYATALVAAELLFQMYGADGVRNLLHNPAMLDQVTADLDKRLKQ
jgi:hypothetical protein